jgi:hypothetical protein
MRLSLPMEIALSCLALPCLAYAPCLALALCLSLPMRLSLPTRLSLLTRLALPLCLGLPCIAFSIFLAYVPCLGLLMYALPMCLALPCLCALPSFALPCRRRRPAQETLLITAELHRRKNSKIFNIHPAQVNNYSSKVDYILKDDLQMDIRSTFDRFMVILFRKALLMCLHAENYFVRLLTGTVFGNSGY